LDTYLLLEVFLAGDGAENVEHQATVGPDVVVSVDRDDVERVEVDEVVRSGHDFPLYPKRKCHSLSQSHATQKVETKEGSEEDRGTHSFAVRDFGVEFARQHVEQVEFDRLVRFGVGLRLFDALRGLREQGCGVFGDLGEVLEEELLRGGRQEVSCGQGNHGRSSWVRGTYE
jgi:hypothetical protein